LTDGGVAAAAEGAEDGPCALKVWRVDLIAAGPALVALERETPRRAGGDRRYIESIADESVAAERLAARIALRVLIEHAAGARWRGVEMTRGAFGKPELGTDAPGFSVSHVPGLALIAIAASQGIGVDLERERVVHVDDARRELIEAAAAAIAPASALPGSGDDRFLQAWVRLEALAKALGCGIGRLLTPLGIVGQRARDAAAVTQRARDLQAEAALTVCDLPLAAPFYAAVAAPLGAAEPSIASLPSSAEGLVALLGAPRD
jgi:4'-phosphopantetheinyl transferase